MSTPKRAVWVILALVGFLAMNARASTADARIELELPTRSFPEGISVGDDGSFYIGSLTSGEVLRRTDRHAGATTFIAAGHGGLTSPLGLWTDQQRGLLWVCSGDLSVGPAEHRHPSALKAYALVDASLRFDLVLPGGGLCNDITALPNGDLLITDSFNPRIMRWASGTDRLQEWLRDERFASAAGTGLNGIAALPDSSILVNHFSSGRLYRVWSRVGTDGGLVANSTEEVALSRPLAQPDGMRVLADGRVLLVEQDTRGGNGRISELRMGGRSTDLIEWISSLDSPTAIAESRGRIYFVEGQYRSLFVDKSLVPQPFRVRSMAIPATTPTAE